MSAITIRETEAMRLDAGFCTKPVIFPCPTTDEIPFEKAQSVLTDVFTEVMKKYGIVGESEFTRVIPRELARTLKDIYVDVTVTYGVKNVDRSFLSDIFPSNNSDVFPDDGRMIYSERVVIQITRLVMQAAFDALGETKTNMYVDTPFKPGETKWGNIVSAYEPASLDSVTTNINIDSVNALRVSGVSFDNPVLLPVPDMYYLTKIEARKITRNTFDNVLSTVGVSQFSTAPYEDFNSINTASFTTNLYNVITDAVDKYYDRSGYDAENELIDALKPLFPDDNDCDKYPGKIYSLDVIIHITWMVLQTWFDSLSQKETHMSVDNPFTVTNHMWTATQNSDCYE